MGPFFFWSLFCLSFFLLVIVLLVLFSFDHCFACPFFFWSLFCLSFFLLVIRTGKTMAKRKKDRQNNGQQKKGQAKQAKQWPTEKRTGKTMTRKKKGQALPVLFSFGPNCFACPFFFLAIVLPVLFSFGHCFACPFFFWSLFCLSFFLLVIVLTMTKRKKDRQNNDQKKKGQAKQ
jgi:heme exporter protein D